MIKRRSTDIIVCVLSCVLTGLTACQGDTRPGTVESTYATTPTPTAYGCTVGVTFNQTEVYSSDNYIIR